MGRWKGARFESEDFDRKASKAMEVNIEEDYHLDQNYDLELYPRTEITSEGLLIVAKLKPKPEKSSLPEFWFRWDERGHELDVDIYGAAAGIKDRFRKGKQGYEGHHPKRKSPAERTYEIDIWVPEINVFHGCISLSLETEVTMRASLSIKLDVAVVKKDNCS